MRVQFKEFCFKRFSAGWLCCLAATILSLPASAAENRFLGNTAGATFNWNSAGNWGGGVPGSSDDVQITNVLTGAGLLTVTGSAANATVNFIRIGSTVAGGVDQTNRLLWIQNTLTSSFGVINNARGILEISNSIVNLKNGAAGDNNLTFVNNGNIIIKNNGTLNILTGQAGTRRNDGTMTLESTTGTATFDYAGTSGFTNAGTIIARSVSSGNFITGSNATVGSAFFANTGTINVQSGQLVVMTGNAFSQNGFANDGTIIISDGATFTVSRTQGAWEGNNGGVWSNKGTVIMLATEGGAGAFYTLRQATAATTTRTNSNFGTFQGAGTLRFRFNNDGGTLYASNGVLTLEEALVGNVTGAGGGGTLRAGNALNSGTLVFAGGVGVGAQGTLNGSIAITNNSAIVFAGANNWTLNSLAQIGGIAGNDRGSIISSNNRTVFLNNGGYVQNNGTLMVVGGSGINYGQSGDLTNNFVMTGVGSFTGAFGNNNNSIINKGTIAAVQGGVLTLDPRNAFSAGGISNTSVGTIIISNGSTLAMVRSNQAWGVGPLLNNSGTILIDNGTLETWVRITAAQSLTTTNYIRNDGTIIARGQGVNENRIDTGIDNFGTILVTNNTAVLSIGATVAMTNAASGKVFVGGLNSAATIQATNAGRLFNAGRLEGQGTLTLGRTDNGSGGANANLLNQGVIVATNYGGAATGTLTINTGDAFSLGGFRNDSGGFVYVGTNMYLVLNRTANAWGGVQRIITNQGTVFMQGGTLTTSTGLGAADATATRTNFNLSLITGWGTVNMIISNGTGAEVLADARGILNRNQGTLTVSLVSFTNNFGSTVGAIGTNSWLNVLLPTGNALVNFGTVQLSAGNIVINNANPLGTISNYFAIAGVGDVSTFPIVQVGNSASLIAKDPTDGETALIASVDPTNQLGQLLGSLDNAELRLTVTGGGNSLVNRGSMTIEGGSITIANAGGVISNDTGGIFYGRGTNHTQIAAASTTSKILASNGLLRVRLLGNVNSGSLEAFAAGSELLVTNSFLENLGTIKANNGSIRILGNTITNSGTIHGAGYYSNGVVNTSTGLILANGGVMNVGTASASVSNAAGGTIRITAGTLSIGAAFWNNAGNITNASGAVLNRDNGDTTTGVMTNSGLIVNLGTIGVQAVNRGNITNSGGTIARSLTNLAGGFILSSGGTFAGTTVDNRDTIKATNSLVRLDANIVRNTGTLIGGTAGGVTMQITNLTQNMVNQGFMILDSPVGGATNLAFDVRRTGGSGEFTNDTTGVIRGAGFFKTGDFTPGGQNYNQFNNGSILATNGALIVQPGDAQAQGGIVNMANGTVDVAPGATFGIQRADTAWSGGAILPRNEGTIQLNGGSFTYYGNGLALANDRSLSNAATGRILGFGTISAGIINLGTISVSNSTLYVNNNKTAAGANVWGIKNLGTILITNGATLILDRTAADWAANEGLNNSGTLRFTGGEYQSAVAGTIRLATNLLASSGTGGIYGNGTFSSALDAQSGTISAEGGTLTIRGPVMSNGGAGDATFQAIGAGNVLQFFGGGNFVAASALNANSGGTILFSASSAASNATINGVINNSGGSLVVTGAHNVVFNNAANRNNSGTLLAAGNASISYGSSGNFTNSGTIRTFTQGGTFDGRAGASSLHFVNAGTLIAGAGSTLTIHTTNAFSVGFTNTATGRIFIENGAHFIISRTSTAWTDPSADRSAKNMGSITMDGGTLATFQSGGTSFTVNRDIENSGWIDGYGFINARLNNLGTINVTGGDLEIDRFTNGVDAVINISAGNTLRKTAGVTLVPVNLGTININGGTLSANGSIENSGAINFIGTGTISSGTHLRNFGQIVTRNGQINLDGSIVVTNIAGGSIFVSNGTMKVNSPLLRNAGDVTLFRSAGTIFGGALNGVSGSLLVSGSATAVSRLVVDGVFTNAGRVEFFRSMGTFHSAVVNSGTWITDPTTNVFHDTLTVTSSGYITAAAGDLFHFTTNDTGGASVASFVNQSLSNQVWNTQNATLNNLTAGDANIGTKFLFEGDSSLSLTQEFFHAGLTLTGGFVGVPSSVTDTQTVTTFSAVAGFVTNFAIGTLELTNTVVRLSDTFGTVSPDDGNLGGLFVKNLFIAPDATLIISNNMRVYFINSNNWSLANITLGAGAEIHQLTETGLLLAVVPEPSVALLWLCGFATFYASRRRHRKRR